ncbi:ethyl tert-butyl ether degradation EthD [Karstenula rhodostoma CBS 690.94]|uniref:Ethyl tert-butyl ether degradation EthD n=1 Tax=Karstenula rhodostoma CBS 690.94 TaxID=1392251 RepID=A0A9P4PFG8_9PLEO|nr:ethyl tert-butyl ether degradation EthD [Karstenula rhodostoma CBS 690.94]
MLYTTEVFITASKMPAQISVLYPRKATFDLDYYLATHMPLAAKHWTPYGLRKYTVTQYDDPESPYSIGAVLEFDSLDAFKKFSNEHPTIIAGEIKEAKTTS